DRFIEVGDAAVVVALLAKGEAPVAVVDRLLGPRPFPRIDVLRTGRDPGVGVWQLVARLGGGVSRERHGRGKCAPKSPCRAAHAVSRSESGVRRYGIGICGFGSLSVRKSCLLECPLKAC